MSRKRRTVLDDLIINKPRFPFNKVLIISKPRNAVKTLKQTKRTGESNIINKPRNVLKNLYNHTILGNFLPWLYKIQYFIRHGLGVMGYL